MQWECEDEYLPWSSDVQNQSMKSALTYLFVSTNMSRNIFNFFTIFPDLIFFFLRVDQVVFIHWYRHCGDHSVVLMSRFGSAGALSASWTHCWNFNKFSKPINCVTLAILCSEDDMIMRMHFGKINENSNDEQFWEFCECVLWRQGWKCIKKIINVWTPGKMHLFLLSYRVWTPGKINLHRCTMCTRWERGRDRLQL